MQQARNASREEAEAEGKEAGQRGQRQRWVLLVWEGGQEGSGGQPGGGRGEEEVAGQGGKTSTGGRRWVLSG